MSGNNKDTTALILAAMDDLGPADARTIAEKADVGYSTAVRKLRDWNTNGEIAKIDRGADPAHYALLPTDQPLPEHLQPAHLPTPTGAIFDDVDDEPAADGRDCEDAEQVHQPSGDAHEADADELTAEAETQPEEDPTGAADDIATVDGDLEADIATAVLPHGDATAVAAQIEDGDGEQDQGELLAEPAIEAGERAEADASEGHGEDASDQAPPADGTAVGSEDAGDMPTVAELDGDPDADAAPQPTPTVTAGKAPRRPKAYFRTEAMVILRAHPDRAYSVGEIAKLILAKEIDAGAPVSTTVSSGAISNALFKAAGAGECLVVQEKNPATFQAA